MDKGAPAHPADEGRHEALMLLARLDQTNWRDAARTIIEADAKALGVERVGFWRLSDDEQAIVSEFTWMASEKRYESACRLDAAKYPHYLQAISERRVVAAADALTDPRVRELGDDYLRPRGIVSMMDVPVWSRGMLVGILCHEHVGSPRAWSEADQQWGVLMAEMISRALEVSARHEAQLARARALETLAAERSLLRDVLAQMPASVVVVGADCQVILANDFANGLAQQDLRPGASLADVVRHRLFFQSNGDVCDIDSLPVSRSLHHDEYVAGEELHVHARDGRLHVLSAYSAPVHDPSGRTIAAVGVAVDITRQKEVEEQLAAEARLRETFLGVLGHDLRTPLTATLMRARMLERSPADAELVRTHASGIVDAAVRMSRLISDLLTFAHVRGSSEGMPVRKAPADLSEICRKALDDLRLTARAAPIALEVEGDTTGVWDADRLGQVVTNLVTNALSHGRPGAPVTVRVEDAGSDVRLHVHNEGPPIPEREQRNIFEAFRTSSRGRPAGGGHTGLGLFVVRAAVRAHGGDVEVRSREGEGTTFSVRLPRGAPMEEQRPPLH